MENGKYLVDFFLGANTPQGFVSRFDQLADPAEGWRKFIIKGGPGTGKSGMMKRLAAELSSRTNRLELIHCSSDVGSLDAVIAADLKASIADGTAPHGGRTQAHKCAVSPTVGHACGRVVPQSTFSCRYATIHLVRFAQMRYQPTVALTLTLPLERRSKLKQPVNRNRLFVGCGVAFPHFDEIHEIGYQLAG